MQGRMGVLVVLAVAGAMNAGCFRELVSRGPRYKLADAGQPARSGLARVNWRALEQAGPPGLAIGAGVAAVGAGILLTKGAIALHEGQFPAGPRSIETPVVAGRPMGAPEADRGVVTAPPKATAALERRAGRLDARAPGRWREWLIHTTPEKRWRAAQHLGSLDTLPDAAVTPLIVCTHDPDDDVRRHAVLALGKTDPARAAEVARALVRALDDAAPLVRFAAANALEQLGGPAACVLPQLQAKLRTVRSAELRRHLAKAVRAIRRAG